MQHDWIKSTLGHGETMCSRCFVTNREAAVLGISNDCDTPPKPQGVQIIDQKSTQIGSVKVTTTFGRIIPMVRK